MAEPASKGARPDAQLPERGPRATAGFPPRLEYPAIAAFMVLGVTLRTWQYAGGASLWFDEAMLARGIVEADLVGVLAAPLPYDQIAPKGFLLLQKLIVLAMGPTDYALRIVPYVCSLVALAVFARLATRILDGAGAVVAVILFATAVPLISFGALAKQYSSDVCVAVLLWWLVWELTSRPVTARRAAWAALAGATLVWFSQPGVLMLAAFGTLFMAWPLVSSSRCESRRSLAALLGLWGLSAGAVMLAGFASMTPATREFMYRFWDAGFPGGGRLWPLGRIAALLGRGGELAGLAYPLPALYAVLLAGGVALLWSQNRRAFLLLAAPTAVTLGAAVARQYPFSDRLILFLVPAVILAIAAAIEGLRRLVWPVSSRLSGAIALALVATAVYPVAATPPVYLDEHVKPVLAHMQAERRQGDPVYVYHLAEHAVAFYASQYGLNRSEYTVGDCHLGNNRAYLEELDAFRGRPRVWVLMTHTLVRPSERADILDYLDAIGTRVDSLIVASRAVGRTPSPAEVYLYDFSDLSKAARTSAATFAVSGSATVGSHSSCR